LIIFSNKDGSRIENLNNAFAGFAAGHSFTMPFVEFIRHKGKINKVRFPNDYLYAKSCYTKSLKPIVSLHSHLGDDTQLSKLDREFFAGARVDGYVVLVGDTKTTLYEVTNGIAKSVTCNLLPKWLRRGLASLQELPSVRQKQVSAQTKTIFIAIYYKSQ